MMDCKRMTILTILVLTILSLFFSSIYAQVWDIEFSPNLAPVASKVSSKIRETYLKDNDVYNNNASSSKYDNKETNKSTGIYKIYSGQGDVAGYTNTTSSSILKKVGFSSIDDVHTAVAINDVGKVPNALPVTIGSSVEDVISAMGTPESIQRLPNAFKYRYSYVYFDNDWKVQSWTNKGHLKVTLEKIVVDDDLLHIDPSLFDEVFKLENVHPKKEPLNSESKKTLDEMIEEFLEFLKN